MVAVDGIGDAGEDDARVLAVPPAKVPREVLGGADVVRGVDPSGSVMAKWMRKSSAQIWRAMSPSVFHMVSHRSSERRAEELVVGFAFSVMPPLLDADATTVCRCSEIPHGVVAVHARDLEAASSPWQAHAA